MKNIIFFAKNITAEFDVIKETFILLTDSNKAIALYRELGSSLEFARPAEKAIRCIEYLQGNRAYLKCPKPFQMFILFHLVAPEFLSRVYCQKLRIVMRNTSVTKYGKLKSSKIPNLGFWYELLCGKHSDELIIAHEALFVRWNARFGHKRAVILTYRNFISIVFHHYWEKISVLEKIKKTFFS